MPQARASADIVLTQPGLATIVDAIVIARCIFRRIANFLNYRIAATLQLLIFFFIAVFAFDPQHYNPRVRRPLCLARQPARYTVAHPALQHAGRACLWLLAVPCPMSYTCHRLWYLSPRRHAC